MAGELGWDISFAQSFDPDVQEVLKAHFPQVAICSSNIPKVNVELFSTRVISPPRFVHSKVPNLDMDYLELALQSIKLASELLSRWVVIESSTRTIGHNKGYDFLQILKKLTECGYGFAYRVLDSQYFGVPQARRSVFIVGYFGDWRPPAGVLFDQISFDEHIKQDRRKSLPTAVPQDLDTGSPLVLSYKVAQQNRIHKICPRLSHLKEVHKYNYQHIPYILVRQGEVRHFTPIEAERLQGLNDNFTKVFVNAKPFGKKKRYGIISNSGCVPVFYWLFKRLEQVNQLLLDN